MDKKLTIKERILSFLESEGIKKAEFFEKTGIQSSNFKGKHLQSQIGGDMLVRILTEYRDISPSWLMLGEGDMLNSKENVCVNLEQYRTESDGIPLIPFEAAAGVFQGEQNVMLADCEHFYVPIFREAEFLIPIKGDSMQPKYNSGDIVACKKISPRSSFFQWGRVYVVDTEQGVLIKRVFEGNTKDTIRLVSDNKAYPPMEVPKVEIYNMALVLGTLRPE